MSSERRRKRIAETSRAAWADLQPSLAARANGVLDGLHGYRQRFGVYPTSYELLRFLQAESPTIDLNAVRPRLTELKDAGRVETAGKRRCSITGRGAYTWTVATPRPIPEPASFDAVVQETLAC